MQLIAWNSQGAKWDALWDNWIPQLGLDDVTGVILESGFAPWVQRPTVRLPLYKNKVYPLDSKMRWFNKTKSSTSHFCQGIASNGNNHAFWIPWVKDPDDLNKQDNTRCSVGAAFVPKSRKIGDVLCLAPQIHRSDGTVIQVSWRPVVRISLARTSQVDFTIFVVHLSSGAVGLATKELSSVTSPMTDLIPQGSAAIVVGDLNINLLTATPTTDKNWRILRTNGATQQSGGELDWALLYDPQDRYGNASATVLQQYNSGNNNSDHSVIRYSIPLA